METQQKIRAILAEELEVEASELKNERELSEFDMDSLTFIQLITEFQEAFSIDISIHDLNQYTQETNISTVGDLITLIEEEIQKQRSE